MLTGLIVGLALGLFIGWLRLRQMATNLNTLTMQNNELCKALRKSSELLKASSCVIEKQQAVIELKERPASTQTFAA